MQVKADQYGCYPQFATPQEAIDTLRAAGQFAEAEAIERQCESDE